MYLESNTSFWIFFDWNNSFFILFGDMQKQNPMFEFQFIEAVTILALSAPETPWPTRMQCSFRLAPSRPGQMSCCRRPRWSNEAFSRFYLLAHSSPDAPKWRQARWFYSLRPSTVRYVWSRHIECKFSCRCFWHHAAPHVTWMYRF